MHERHIARLIYKRIIGTITPEETDELEAWRKADPRNEATYRRLLDTHFLEREYRRAEHIDARRPLEDMKARIRRESRPSRLRRRWAVSLVAAASLAAVICISYFGHSPVNDELTPIARQLEQAQIRHGKTQAMLTLADGSEISLGEDSARNSRLIARQRTDEPEASRKARINKLTTPRGGEFKIILEDSTEVWLNAESQLIYPENFTGSERRVTVKGEAYFKVAKDSLRPFYVESDNMQVRVYGTEFNINAYNEENCIYTTLVSGSIALRPLNDTHAELVLTPGHQAVFLKSDRSTRVRPVDTRAVTSWHDGRFSFEELTLQQIMTTLSRWYNFDFRFADERLASTVFKGSAPRYAELAEVLSILEKSGGIIFRVEGKTIVVEHAEDSL